MEKKPRRPWFRFSLRTLFVVVTVVCVWLGFEVQYSRKREAMRTWVNARGGSYFESTERFRFNVMNDRPVLQFVLSRQEFSPEDAERLKAQFPECTSVLWSD